ncbi:MAG: short-chain dehydrogenase/reductase [Acidimicrobiales bacterium]|nr:short-chain dehydrogenase/reductase [Acidimicrobiales bacterium]
MDLRLDGKTALVTGASKGIGFAIAKAMAESGAKVMLSSRKQEGLEKAAAEIDGEVDVFAANAGEPEQAEACINATVERFGALDILVNNAATNPYFGKAIDIDLSRYDKTFQVNLRGVFVWTQLAWKTWMQEHGGNVINIASIGGLHYGSFIGIYDTTKAAVIYLTKHLAAELAPDVRVNGIAPGLVKTDFARALYESGEEAVAAMMPLKRLGVPTDIAPAAVYLASDAASWVTGEVLIVDGGMLVRP